MTEFCFGGGFFCFIFLVVFFVLFFLFYFLLVGDDII